MGNVTEVRLPKTAFGNDPNDNRTRGYLDLPEKPLEQHAVKALLHNPTEDNVAIAFALEYRDRLLYVHNNGGWHVWTGTHWKREETLYARELIRRLARERGNGSTTLGKASFVTGVEKLAKGDREFSVHASDMDNDRFLLNTPAGTYDLKSMSRRNHDPADRITNITSVSPASKGGSVFLKFLAEVTQGDRSLQAFLQRALGSILSGCVEEHWIMFWIGTGRNGKNTLGDAIEEILGGYAKKVSSSLLMSRHAESHPTEIANLQGLRLAISSEVPEGSFLNEARVKELTGDATLSARLMRTDFFEFQRTHKHLVYGNSKPQLRAVDQGIRSRIKIVPFDACFKDREDPELPDKLKAEYPFILYWLIEGHRQWLENGKKIGSCPAVDAAVEGYFANQSTPDLWLEECCQAVPNEGQGLRYWHTATDLYQSYSNWKRDRGESPVAQTRWAEFMATRGFEKKKSDGVRYIGLKLNEFGTPGTLSR